MGAFVGPLGSLVELTQWAESQSVTTGQAPTYFTGLDGTRTAFLPPVVSTRLREWEVAMSKARPRQAAAFQALCLGALGPGPFVFCDALSQVTNLLTPAQSMLGGAGVADAVTIPGLGAAPGVFVSGGVFLVSSGTPVRPGRTVSASVWAAAAEPVVLTAECLTASGDVVTKSSVSSVGNPDGHWVSTSFTPGGRAAQVSLSVTSTAPVTVACPAVTWTPSRMPWSPGRGALEVIVHDLKEQYEQASPWDEGRQRVSYTATVTEVGSGA